MNIYINVCAHGHGIFGKLSMTMGEYRMIQRGQTKQGRLHGDGGVTHGGNGKKCPSLGPSLDKNHPHGMPR